MPYFAKLFVFIIYFGITSIVTKLASNKSMGKSGVAAKLLLSIGMPVIFLLAFLCQQIISVDSIGWVNGFSHPLTGWDHLVTMLAVGIWAAQLRGQAIWMLPLAFVGVMSLGGVAGAAGVTVPSVEGIILLSCAVFSVLITRKVRFNAKINVMIVAFFAFFHGFAHGQEISASASLISYTLGFMLATLLLHGAGILVAKLVILTITTVISVIFATAAIAEVQASSLESNQIFAGDADQQTDAPGFFNFQQRIDRQCHAQTCAFSSIEKHDATDGETGWERQRFKDLTGSVSYFQCAQPSHAYFQIPKQQSSTDCLAFDLKPYQVSGGNYALPSKVLLPDLQLVIAFNSLFPSINNTPGMLLSNGVGLNSPPTSKFAISSLRLFNHSRSTPVSSFKDIRLQAVFVKQFVDKTYIPLTRLFSFRAPLAWGQSCPEFSIRQSNLRSREHSFPGLQSSCFIRNTPVGVPISRVSVGLLRSIRINRFNSSVVNKTTLNLKKRRKNAESI